ncbi:MAG: amidohydrolase family protein [Pseudomonadales bacterium]|nr:amidohydrolase family protein [Pseudomonadales bacterium]
MSHDLVVRNGQIVDGTGAVPFDGDIAISNGQISAVGQVEGRGEREIDAEGAVITPGFIDTHTHFDAQAGWDPLLTPASCHGVTTALIGNCGVTFAPCKPDGHEFLANMMETVEDIPRRAILEGLAWDWESYGEYLDSMERLNPAINLVGLVGHCASRFYVMGERAVDEDPTEDEIKQIAELVGASIREGAVGFSTSRLPAHVLPDGRSIPGTFAKPAELTAISKEVGANQGILQFVLDYQKLDDEMSLIADQAKTAGTRLLFSAPYQPTDRDDLTGFDSAVAQMQADGIDVSGLTLPRSGGFLSGLTTGLFPANHGAWRELKDLSFEDRLARVQDANFRARLVADAQEDASLVARMKHTYWLGDADQPNYAGAWEDSLASQAASSGKDPFEIWLDVTLQTEGQALFHIRFFNHNLDTVSKFLKADWVLPGIGDAGAHVSQIMDSGWTSFMLSHWVRDKGVFSIEEAVRKLTSAQARVIGIGDRGVLAPGYRADINVVDLANVCERHPELVHDFPNGAPRLIQKAVGYKATICNGEVILENDEHTGARSGTVIRSN